MTENFYQELVPDTDFVSLATVPFTPVPEDWLIGVTDIFNSTGHIAAGRYKTVNMVGASVIAAVMNTLQGAAFPYVFAGDGASFAVPPSQADLMRETLATLRSWVQSEFDMTLRAALLPVSEIRAAGHAVRVARYAPSPGVDYAMFSGGGLAWAEAQMKSNVAAVPAAQTPGMPDLTGLSCRWNNMKARNGIILSLVVLPAGDAAPFARLAEQVTRIADGLERGGHPVSDMGPEVQYPPPGLSLEAHTMSNRLPFWLRQTVTLGRTLFSYSLFRFRIRLGQFDPVHYRAGLHRNADFRKYDDGLKMTLDCDPHTRDRILALLHQAQADGIIRYGHYEQDEAMVTCIVPSAIREDHVHFVDGASGGYTMAAARMKSG